ncbi:MAG: cyclic nucleotide-binding domain-containing protein [Bdellovibrionales bacterium]
MNFMWDNIFRREAAEGSISKLLQDNFVFSTLSKKELRFIESIVHEREYKSGEIIFRQGEAGVGMYIISRGSVDVFVSETSFENTDEKKETHITQLKPGDFFGEISLVEDNGKRTAGAVATSACSLIGFFKPDLMELMERNPSIGAKVLFQLGQVLGKRLSETTEKITLIKRELLKIQGRKRKNVSE